MGAIANDNKIACSPSCPGVTAYRAISANMAKPLKNYIRKHRRLRGLSQRELASILGCQSGRTVSRYEQSSRQPSLEIALRLAWFLGVPSEQLWPGLRQEHVEQALRPCQVLLDKLWRGKRTKKTELKIACLTERLRENLIVVEHDTN